MARSGWLALALAVLASTPAATQPTTPAVGAAAPEAPPLIQPILRNWTRAEVWRYFEPPPATGAFTPGDPTTAHVGNRLLAGLRIRRGRVLRA